MRAALERPPLRPRAALEAVFEDLDRLGCCLIERALGDDALRRLRARLDEQAAGEAAAGRGFFDSGANQRIWMLVNKGRMFRDLVMNPLVELAMGRLLGPKFLLSSLTANIARPGGTPMYLHSDQGYVDFPTEKALVGNMLFMLDDFTEANGATRIVPGSHRSKEIRRYDAAETVAAEGPAGTIMIFDGRLIHGAGASVAASGERRALLAYHCRPFVRQQENFFLGLDPQVRRTERPAFLARLGFEIWAGLGRIESPAEKGLLAPVETAPGPLDGSGRPTGDGDPLPADALAAVQ